MKLKLTMSFRGRLLIYSNGIEDSVHGTRGELVQNKPLISALSTDVGSLGQFLLYRSAYTALSFLIMQIQSQSDLANLLQPIGRNRIPQKTLQLILLYQTVQDEVSCPWEVNFFSLVIKELGPPGSHLLGSESLSPISPGCLNLRPAVWVDTAKGRWRQFMCNFYTNEMLRFGRLKPLARKLLKFIIVLDAFNLQVLWVQYDTNLFAVCSFCWEVILLTWLGTDTFISIYKF